MAANSVPPLPPVAPIDLGALAKLPTVSLKARHLVECFLTGRHHSPYKGTAPEFAEYRSYQPGDELRRIDWRLYGRSDRVVVKQFEDESQLRICLALDLGASLRYSSRPELLTKFDFARTLLAAVALLGRRQNDSVGLALIGEAVTPGQELRDFLRPATSPAHYAGIFRRLETPPEARPVELPAALRAIASLLPRGGLIVLASDCYAELGPLDQALRFLRSQRIDLIALHTLDPMETDFDLDVAGRFQDLETGAVLPLNSASCRAGYLERFGRYRRDLLDLFRRHECDLVLQRTDGNPLSGLAAYLARRGRLLR